MQDVSALLNPKSVAVIGASREKTKLGRLVMDNIISGGFKGKVYPVNPNAKKIAGLSVYKTVADIPGEVDLVIIAIPVQFVLEVSKQCVAKKVKAVIVITSGFGETGIEGLKIELKLKALFEKVDIAFLGPNCLGLFNASIKMNATFARNVVKKGKIAFLSQSGALGTAALDWAEQVGIGLSHFVSLGNKTSLSENDFIEYFAHDAEIKAIALYLEDFVDGQRFMDLLRQIKKPVIILKPGKSEAAQKALGSHTGSLAQSDTIISAALAQCGAIRVHSIEELFNAILLLDTEKKLKGPNIGIVTNAGGPGVITTDAIESNNLNLTALDGKTEKMLALHLPPAANVKNPVDVLGDALADRYKTALETLVRDQNVDGIVVLLTPQVMTQISLTAEYVSQLSRKTEKMLIVSFIGGKYVEEGRKVFAKYKIPSFRFPSDAVKSLANVWQHYKNKKLKVKSKKLKVENRSKPKVEAMLFDLHGVVDAQIAEKVLSIYDIPVLPSAFPQDIADARRGGDKLGYPLVMKLIHPQLLHKTDEKAVFLDISTRQELERSYQELEKLARRLELASWKIEIQQFIKGSLELILGVKKDSDLYSQVEGERVLRKHGFGHSILFGMGGIYAEVFNDVALKLSPLSSKDIHEIVAHTKAGQILSGARGKTYNLKTVEAVIGKIDALVQDFPQIAELDINPLFAKDKDVWVVDAKMIVE